MRIRLLPFIALMAVLCPCSHAVAEGPIPDLDYRVTVLVRDFKSGVDFPEAGRVAAEAVTMALEKEGTVHAVRPEYAEREDVKLDGSVIEVKDAEAAKTAEGERSIDLFASTKKRTTWHEVSAPESEYILEGRALAVDETWRLSAELSLRPTNMSVMVGLYGEAQGERALIRAADALASAVSTSLAMQVIERRAEAIRRAVALEMMDRADAMNRLSEMYDSAYRNNAIVPAAVALILASEKLPADDPVVQDWRAKVAKHYGLGAAPFLKSLGLDPDQFAKPDGAVTAQDLPPKE